MEDEMKLSTLFSVYEDCESEMKWCVEMRADAHKGIAVGKDEYAVKWQRQCQLWGYVRRGIVRRIARIEGKAVKP
jgi:hypothetical protein